MRTLYFVSALAGAIDVVLKYHYAKTLTPHVRVFDTYPFDLTLHFNEGIAFNIPVPLLLTVLASVAIVILILPSLTKPGASAYTFTALVGILGNAFDRAWDGAVTDYLLFFTGSVFNISDILILLGIIGILMYAEYVKD